jgi:hypothetical protein
VALLITIMNVGAPMITGLKLGLLPRTIAPMLGNAIGVAGLLGLYSAACMINARVFGRPLFPFPGPIIK